MQDQIEYLASEAATTAQELETAIRTGEGPDPLQLTAELAAQALRLGLKIEAAELVAAEANQAA